MFRPALALVTRSFHRFAETSNAWGGEKPLILHYVNSVLFRQSFCHISSDSKSRPAGFILSPAFLLWTNWSTDTSWVWCFFCPIFTSRAEALDGDRQGWLVQNHLWKQSARAEMSSGPSVTIDLKRVMIVSLQTRLCKLALKQLGIKVMFICDCANTCELLG